MGACLLLYWFTTLVYTLNTHAAGFPAQFDCSMRAFALEFAQSIQPFLSQQQLKEIADALNGSPEAICRNLTINGLPNFNQSSIPKQKIIPSLLNTVDMKNAVYIDAKNGIDNTNTNDGSIHAPFKSLYFGLNALRNSKSYKKSVLKNIILRKGKYYLSKPIHFNASDSNLKISNYNNELVSISGAIKLNCSGIWKLYKNASNNNNYYKCNLTENNQNKLLLDKTITGLRVNEIRAIRARFPNANPETDGFGSTLKAKSWIAPIYPNPTPKINIQPDEPFRNDTCDNYFQKYTLGVSGTSCYNFDPQAGYWCSTKTKGGGAGVYKIPSGITYDKQLLPHTPYANISNAILQTWRPGHWSSWMFELNETAYNINGKSKQQLKFSRGGYQGARGAATGDEFYVENILEELDAETEWFYNNSEKVLYYRNNVSNESPDKLLFEVTNLKVLFNYTGTKNKPITNMTLQGIVLRDTAYTYMDPHGMPSGGDWALERTGAIYMEGAEHITIKDNLFTRLDGNAISINKYNRNVTIFRNEFVWQGDNVISLWGDTTSTNDSVPDGMGWDGTNGLQPRGINVSYNFVHEVGIFEKQSSFYFQAKSCQNYIGYNIFMNGPRAGINFNDGFGGGTLIEKNLLFNTCRESGSHGPFNSWDRQVYVTSVANGTPSVIKAYDEIRRNFIISNYQGKYAVDNDDGSCYYDTHDNFLVYGQMGQKSNFGGHDNHHYNNIYGYVNGQCFSICQGNGDTNYQLTGHNNWFFNNTCYIFPMYIKDYGNNGMYGDFDCKQRNDTWPRLGNNKIYTLNKTAVNTIGLCEMNEKEFQTKHNLDLNTVIYGPTDINNSDIIVQAKKLIF